MTTDNIFTYITKYIIYIRLIIGYPEQKKNLYICNAANHEFSLLNHIFISKSGGVSLLYVKKQYQGADPASETAEEWGA